mmetsp:Transcript_48243/g.94254  ORF Transcript_48243/g.94254 Transcript_48243/m.94254 type:complete len:458 (+) Transcript_48243:156-1529(+)
MNAANNQMTQLSTTHRGSTTPRLRRPRAAFTAAALLLLSTIISPCGSSRTDDNDWGEPSSRGRPLRGGSSSLGSYSGDEDLSGGALPLAPPAGPAAYAAEITIGGVYDRVPSSSDTVRRRLSRFGATHAVRGMMFDVTSSAQHALTVDRLHLNLLHAGEAMNCTLYVKKEAGPWLGNAYDPAQWRAVVRREVWSAGRDLPSAFWQTTGGGIEIPAGATRAFYVWVEDPRRSLLVVAGTAGNDTSTKNFDLTVDPVLYSAARFDTFFQHWIFNGRLGYTTSKTERVALAPAVRIPPASVVATDHLNATHFETGAVFHVRAKVAVTVTNLRLLFRYGATERVSVWTKAGTHAVPTDDETWRHLGTVAVDAQGVSSCACLEALPAGALARARVGKGEVRSFYVALEDSRSLLLRKGTRQTGMLSGKNTEVEIMVGGSVQERFGPSFRDYEWIGGVEYVVL